MAENLVRGINHVSVFVEDLVDAERLLTELLGFALERKVDEPDSPTTIAFYRSGTAMVELVRLRDDEQRRERLAGAPAVIDHIAFDVEDVDGAAATLQAAGIRLREPYRPPSDAQGEATVRASHRPRARVFFTDPASSAGVVLQFVQEG